MANGEGELTRLKQGPRAIPHHVWRAVGQDMVAVFAPGERGDCQLQGELMSG